MNSSPGFEGGKIGRWLLVGVVLAALAVALFVLLWVLFGNLGFEQFPRLILSMCIPPAVIALVLGLYVLIFRARS